VREDLLRLRTLGMVDSRNIGEMILNPGPIFNKQLERIWTHAFRGKTNSKILFELGLFWKWGIRISYCEHKTQEDLGVNWSKL